MPEKDKLVTLKVSVTDHAAFVAEAGRQRLSLSAFLRVGAHEKIQRDTFGRNRGIKALDLLSNGTEFREVAEQLGVDVSDLRIDLGDLRKLLSYRLIEDGTVS